MRANDREKREERENISQQSAIIEVFSPQSLIPLPENI